MAEPTESMRERIAKALAAQEDMCSPERWEIEGDLYRSDYLATADYLMRTVLSQPSPPAAPPSIADMVPGTTFLANPRGWTNPAHWIVTEEGRAISTDSWRWCRQDDIDPSTIRENAPHENECMQGLRGIPCDCWKADV